MRFLHGSIEAASIVQAQHRRRLGSTAMAETIRTKVRTMTHTSIVQAQPGFGTGAVKAALAGGLAYLRKAALYARTVNELNALSDRDLADLGIGRGDVRRLAREAAFRA